MGIPDTAAVMTRLKEAFDKSGMSLEELGQQMGYEEGAARRSAWQFLNKTSDPRLSMVLKCVSALGIELEDIIQES